jgi:hypothetical protein
MLLALIKPPHVRSNSIPLGWPLLFTVATLNPAKTLQVCLSKKKACEFCTLQRALVDPSVQVLVLW